jgi:hypothetical protein
MATVSNQPVASPSIWDQVSNTASNAGSWIVENSRKAAASASDLGSRAWAAVCDVFSTIAEAFSTLKNHIAALPMNAKVVLGFSVALTAVGGYLLAKWCTPTATATSTTTATTQLPPQNPAAGAAGAAPVADAAPATVVVANP